METSCEAPQPSTSSPRGWGTWAKHSQGYSLLLNCWWRCWNSPRWAQPSLPSWSTSRRALEATDCDMHSVRHWNKVYPLGWRKLCQTPIRPEHVPSRAPWHALMALPRLKQLENSLNDSFSRASAIIQALALAQAAIAQLYVYVFGLTTAMSIWLKSDRACCHFCPLPQASIMVLYVITSGKQFANFISVKSCKLQCHLLALLKRLIALLNRKVWTSDCCACKAMQETIRGSRCKPFRSKNRQHSCNSCNYMFAPGIKPMLRSRGIDSKWLLSSMPIRSRKHPTHELLLPRMSWQIWPDWNAENQKLQIGLVRWFYVSKPISVQLAPSIASRCATRKKTVESWDGIRSSRYVSLRQRSTRRIALPLVSQPNQPINKSSLPAHTSPPTDQAVSSPQLILFPTLKTFSLGLTRIEVHHSTLGTFPTWKMCPSDRSSSSWLSWGGDAPIAAAANSFRCQWYFGVWKSWKSSRHIKTIPAGTKRFFWSRTTGH